MICFLTAIAAGFSGCEDSDGDSVYDTIIGRTWSGDLGFVQENRYPLQSNVTFQSDGFGVDELRYADNGEYLDTLNIQWSVYIDKITINYGTVDYPRELRNVYIRNGRLTADLYIDGHYEGVTNLYMQ